MFNFASLCDKKPVRRAHLLLNNTLEIININPWACLGFALGPSLPMD